METQLGDPTRVTSRFFRRNRGFEKGVLFWHLHQLTYETFYISTYFLYLVPIDKGFFYAFFFSNAVAIAYSNISPKQVKNYINYALNSKNIKKTSENFERIFGFEYSISYFTNKKIIEEIARVVDIINI